MKWLYRFLSVAAFFYLLGLMVASVGTEMPAYTFSADHVWAMVGMLIAAWWGGFGSRGE